MQGASPTGGRDNRATTIIPAPTNPCHELGRLWRTRNPVHTRRRRFATDHHLGTAVRRARRCGRRRVSRRRSTTTRRRFSFTPTRPERQASRSRLASRRRSARPTTTAGNVAAPLVDIKTTIYGLVANAKRLPDLQTATIETAPKSDGNCPKGSRSRPAQSMRNSAAPASPRPKASPCNPFLRRLQRRRRHGVVLLHGRGRLPVRRPEDRRHGPVRRPHQAVTARTWSWTCRFRRTSRRWSRTMPNFYGSLIQRDLNFKNAEDEVHGKTVGISSSIGCKGGKRPWSVAFTALQAAGSPR